MMLNNHSPKFLTSPLFNFHAIVIGIIYGVPMDLKRIEVGVVCCSLAFITLLTCEFCTEYQIWPSDLFGAGPAWRTGGVRIKCRSLIRVTYCKLLLNFSSRGKFDCKNRFLSLGCRSGNLALPMAARTFSLKAGGALTVSACPVL